jgi:hypothetical protein
MQNFRRWALFFLLAALLSLGTIHSAISTGGTKSAADDPGDSPALTIYNAQFAVVRQKLPLELKSGVNHMEVTEITSHLEPDSVILRSLDPGNRLQILEQNYRNDSITQELLLTFSEGKTIDFQLPDKSIIQGKIIRSGYVPHYAAGPNFGSEYWRVQQSYVQNGGSQPVIEVNGKLVFSLPGQPIFPALGNDTILKPTLSWYLESDKPGHSEAEFSYVTGGMTWAASYNVVAPPKGNVLDLVGWVTLENQSGKPFRDARIKLMAGDVNKIQPPNGGSMMGGASAAAVSAYDAHIPPVTERSFDEYHLYSLSRSTTLLDREIKQVEFIRASGIQSKSMYVYDGFQRDPNTYGWNMDTIRQQENFGLTSNPKVWAMQEFKNTADNHLGIALPKGRVRFYRRDEDGQLEFTGENEIDHTPKGETVRLYTGNAFDLTGERRRTQFKADYGARWINETFEIKVRNHKTTPAEVRVVEHLYRCVNWEISGNSDGYKKTDAQSIEFTVQIPANGEKVVSYLVHYTW